MVNVTNKVLKFNQADVMPEGVTTDSDGARISFSGAEDSRILVILKNSGSGTGAVVKKGNAVQGSADLEIAIASGETKAVTLESGKYMNVSGDNCGYVVITGTGINVSAIVLP